MNLFMVCLCLIPSIAFGTVKLDFKDGSNVCGEYVESEKTYCRDVIGGDICFSKSEIARIRKVNECGEPEIGEQGKGTDYLKKSALTPLDLSVRSGSGKKEKKAYR